MEGDPLLSGSGIGGTYFNPLPPHGGRRHGDHTPGRTGRKFQSTPSAWRETHRAFFQHCRNRISIHSLRMEGDLRKLQRKWSRPAFQSTPSAWRETPFTAQLETIAFISIHSLRMEGDTFLRKNA